jgi:uncharacterized repeat protein (TIGR03987 family)
VCSERLVDKLKVNHLLFFWLGWVCDTTGTTLMTQIAGKMDLNFHSITGGLAIFLMVGHAMWASLVLFLKQDKVIYSFYKFSTTVWLIWLVLFITRMIGAMIVKSL